MNEHCLEYFATENLEMRERRRRILVPCPRLLHALGEALDELGTVSALGQAGVLRLDDVGAVLLCVVVPQLGVLDTVTFSLHKRW